MNRRKWFSCLLILVLCAALISPGPSLAQKPAKRGLGLIPASPGRSSLPSGLKTGDRLPPTVDNSVLEVLPVGDQGPQNSSVAWATTYYNKTFQEWQERGWDTSLGDHQFSPGMTYNMRTAFTPADCTVDDGMRFPDALAILTKNGALPLSAFGYDPFDPCTQPDTNQLAAAYGYRSLGYGAFFVYGEGGHVTTEQFEALKAHLANGNLVLLGIPVYPGFYTPELNEDVVDVPQPGEEMEGYHAITLVGYNDAVGGQGAFKFVNSWGPSYGGDGYAYLTYDFVLGYAIEAWWMVDAVEPQGCIEGTVLDNNGLPMPDVMIAIDGPTPWTGTTDANGRFESGSILDFGTYTVTPDREGYTFDPASTQVEVAGESCITQDFVAQALSLAVISVEPASQTLNCGDVSTVAIAIRDVAALYGAQFHLTFDPAVIEIVDPDGDPANGIIVPGSIFDENEFEVGQEVVDHDSGQIEYAITLLRVPKALPFEGSGTLAQITVRALAEGVSPLVFISAQISTNGGDPIDVLTEDGIITVDCLTRLSGHAYLEGRDPLGDHSAITVTLEGTARTA
ncbi:MAG: hypothetical protein JXA89_23810, partial [Anaerolineae bacterium]|nr:hypothetical protein [Anaerolineae bacterium]